MVRFVDCRFPFPLPGRRGAVAWFSRCWPLVRRCGVIAFLANDLSASLADGRRAGGGPVTDTRARDGSVLQWPASACSAAAGDPNGGRPPAVGWYDGELGKAVVWER